MVKENVTVCLPLCDRGEVHEAISAAMAPYDYNREDVPDDPEWMAEWDYWQIDGRGCEFPVLHGSEDDPRLIRGELDLRGRPRVFPPGTCDGGPRRLLDFDAARRPVAAAAARDFHDWHDFAARHPAARPLDFFWDKHRGDPAYPPRRVHEVYLGQAVLKALHEERPDLRDRIGSYPVGGIGDDLAAYVEERASAVLPTNALLTLDGQWRGIAGLDLRRYFNAYLDELSADAIVVRVIYHG
jgi:hypothetical protein